MTLGLVVEDVPEISTRAWFREDVPDISTRSFPPRWQQKAKIWVSRT
jgi:hypothetical protein